MTGTDTHIQAFTIGQRLRSLREQGNMTVVEIASRMHLDSRIINALEDDDFASLPDPIYIRGYIRGYSKLLGINADELVNQYEETGGGREPEIIPEVKHASQTSSSDKPVKAFTYLISLGLVMLLIAWWQSNFIVTTPRPSMNIPAAQVEEGPPVIAITPVNLDYVYTLSGYTPDIVQSVPLEPLDLDYIGLDPGIDPDSTADTRPEDVVVTPADPAGQYIGMGDVAMTMPGGPDSIVLNVTADSWIEVVDANNQRVYMNLARAGDTLNLYGSAPFQVLLGFAQGVSVQFNGNPFNQAPYSRSGVARFTLGE